MDAHFEFIDQYEMTDLWSIAHKQSDLEHDHPTTKPVEVVRKQILVSVPQGDSCIDPFLGTGTTMVAAEQTGRICYGMEIEPKYCAVTLERMAGLGLTPELAGG